MTIDDSGSTPPSPQPAYIRRRKVNLAVVDPFSSREADMRYCRYSATKVQFEYYPVYIACRLAKLCTKQKRIRQVDFTKIRSGHAQPTGWTRCYGPCVQSFLLAVAEIRTRVFHMFVFPSVKRVRFQHQKCSSPRSTKRVRR